MNPPKEEDKPNFDGSFYSLTKGMLDRLVPIGMPRLNVPNSMSVLPDLLPLIHYLIRGRVGGPLNFVNPALISHNEILDL